METGFDTTPIQGRQPEDALKLLLQHYVRHGISQTSNADLCRAALVWLADQLHERGDCATFRVYELNPFWLPTKRDTQTAFMFMGLAVTVLPALALASLLVGLGTRWWVTVPATASAWALGGLYRWLHTTIYGGYHRRRPQAVRRRTWKFDVLVRSVAYDSARLWDEAVARIGFGLVGGCVFAFLTRIVEPGTTDRWMPLTVALGTIAVGLAIVRLPGILNQFVAAAIVGAILQLGSHNLLQDALFTGPFAGLLSLVVFYGAEMGEYSSLDSGENPPLAVFKANVWAQLWFEARQWILFGAGFGAIEWALFGNAAWFYGTAGVSGAAVLVYGVIGGAFPLLLYGTTVWQLKRQRYVPGRLSVALDELTRVGLLQRTVGGLGVRFIHPSVARLIVETRGSVLAPVQWEPVRSSQGA